MVPVLDVVDRTSAIVRLDTMRLAAIAGLCRPIPTRSELPVECEESGRWIRINGTVCRFGDKQAKVIRLLYDAWDAGKGWLREQDVLEEAESTSTQIRRLFKGRTDWQEIIEVQSGNCRLRVDENSLGF